MINKLLSIAQQTVNQVTRSHIIAAILHVAKVYFAYTNQADFEWDIIEEDPENVIYIARQLSSFFIMKKEKESLLQAIRKELFPFLQVHLDTDEQALQEKDLINDNFYTILPTKSFN